MVEAGVISQTQQQRGAGMCRLNEAILHPLQDLEQRYMRFRVEVQTALDRNETNATYASLARRIITRENSEANAVAHGSVNVRVAPATTAAPAAGWSCASFSLPGKILQAWSSRLVQPMKPHAVGGPKNNNEMMKK